ncbi:MAG: hypothetical protein KJ061_02535 [Vicinamibacteraceae bacterium]|nr:hypothetical protein [Vicinamibacteraceae bacterium]
MQPAGRVREHLDALVSTLTDIADALVEGRGDTLLATEPVLADAVALLPDTVAAYRGLDEATRHALLADLLRSARSLARCRRHGAVLHTLADLTLAASGRQATYDRQGLSYGTTPRAQFATRG